MELALPMASFLHPGRTPQEESRACLRTLTLDMAYAYSNLHRFSPVNLGHDDRHEPWMPALLKGLDAVDIIVPQWI